MMQEKTIAAIATPPGVGGIAIVRLSGEKAYEVASRVFRPANSSKKLEQAKGYTAILTVTLARMWWNFPAMGAAQSADSFCVLASMQAHSLPVLENLQNAHFWLVVFL